MLLVLGVVPRGLRETMIEETQPAARHVRHQAVEHLSPLLSHVEADVQEVAEEASALRHAEAVGPPDRRLALPVPQGIALRIVVAQKRKEVAHGGVTESLDDRRLR